jgi:hypothetical protein
VRFLAQGFTRDDSPGEDECGGAGCLGGAGWLVGSPFTSFSLVP